MMFFPIAFIQFLASSGSGSGTPPESYSNSGIFSSIGLGSWTNTYGDRWIKVEVWSAGGYGSAGNYDNPTPWGGGGGGGYAMKQLYITNGTIIQYYVPAQSNDAYAKKSGDSNFVYAIAGGAGGNGDGLAGYGTTGDILMTGTDAYGGGYGGSGANGGGNGGLPWSDGLGDQYTNGGGGGGPGQGGGSPNGGQGIVRIWW